MTKLIEYIFLWDGAPARRLRLYDDGTLTVDDCYGNGFVPVDIIRYGDLDEAADELEWKAAALEAHGFARK